MMRLGLIDEAQYERMYRAASIARHTQRMAALRTQRRQRREAFWARWRRYAELCQQYLDRLGEGDRLAFDLARRRCLAFAVTAVVGVRRLKRLRLSFPSIALPNVSLPAIPTNVIPRYSIPRMTFPAISLPQVRVPRMTLPRFALPQLTHIGNELAPMQVPAVLGFLISAMCLVGLQTQSYERLLTPLLKIHAPLQRMPKATRLAANRITNIIAMVHPKPKAVATPFDATVSRLGAPAVAQHIAATDPLVGRVLHIAHTQNTLPTRILDQIPSLDPTSGGEITSGFGYRTNPYREFHEGLDLAQPTGHPVLVSADGIVTFAGWQGGFGNKIEVDHGNGYATWYGHLSHIDVVVGQHVTRGSTIGEVGETGDATGPHLHYQIMHNSVPIDPMPYLHGVPAVTALATSKTR